MENTEGIVQKPFLTYDEQLDMLTEKNLQIKDRKSAMDLLKKHSYFALISGYKKPFKNSDDSYKKNTAFEDIYALYMFDNNLRAIMLKYLLIVEKQMKSLVSYSFCEENGSNQQLYLDATKYNYTIENQTGINDFINRISKIINDPKDYVYIRHQKKKYGNIPLWVLIKALPMGSISKMYSFLKPSTQSKISKEIPFLHENDLMRMLDILSRVRNVCAHNERLFNYKYHKGSINDTIVHKQMNIPKTKDNYQYGKSDLFAILICLKYLLDPVELHTLISEIDEQMNLLFRQTNQIQRSQLEKYMGFPSNWRDIDQIKLVEL